MFDKSTFSAPLVKAVRCLDSIKYVNFRDCPQAVTEIIYMSIVRPLLEYVSCVWDPCAEGMKHDLEVVQRRAAILVLNDYDRHSSVTGMLSSTGWKTLETRRREARLSAPVRFGRRLSLLHVPYARVCGQGWTVCIMAPRLINEYLRACPTSDVFYDGFSTFRTSFYGYIGALNLWGYMLTFIIC